MRGILFALLAAAAILTAIVAGEIGRGFRYSDRYSTYRGGDGGAKALVLTLREVGIEAMRLHVGPEEARFGGVLFVLLDEDASRRLGAEDGDRLLAWARRGGNLVVAHAAPVPLLEPLGVSVTWPEGSGGEPTAETQPLVRVPRGDRVAATEGVITVAMRRPGRYQVSHGGYAVLLGTAADPAAVGIERGAGRVVLLSDPWVFSNRGLGEDGNLELAMGLARSATGAAAGVAFDEASHGFAGDRSIVGYLRRQGLAPALGQGLLAVGLAVAAGRGRRRPERRLAAAASPGSRDFLEAMSRIYAAAGLAAEAARDIAADLLRRAAEDLRLGAGPGRAEVLRALGAVDRQLAGDVAAAIARADPGKWPRQGREMHLVGYHNHALALAARITAAARGRRTR